MIPKYRAWDKETQTMLDVSLIDFKKSVLVGEHWDFGETNFINFDDIHLMQSTGLKDKNGKEIFEGDILTDGHTTGVIRNHPTLGFYTVDESSKEGYLSDTVGTEDFEEAKEFIRNSIEIIGNIHENPELLKVEI